jgi:uncharacterized damage-inducible protein DinB
MPNRDYALMMARYNLWQNESLIKAANTISDSERRAERGAFFGSIGKTFSHIYWGDRMWLSRFEGIEGPGGNIASSVSMFPDWAAFQKERAALDRHILDWARNVPADWFDGSLTWFAGSIGRNKTNPLKLLVVQMFNHQTHHRGQIHAMLTACGAKPEATDLQHMPERYLEI